MSDNNKLYTMPSMTGSGRKLSIILHSAFMLEAVAYVMLSIWAELVAESEWVYYLLSIFVISIQVSLGELGVNHTICGFGGGSSLIGALRG